MANRGHVLSPGVVVEHVGVGQIDLGRRPNRIVRPDHAHLPAVGNAPVDQGRSIAWQRLLGRIGNLTSQAKAARRIAVGTGVPLDEDAVEDRVFGIVDPVLFGQVFPPDPQMDTPHRNVAKSSSRPADFRRGFLPIARTKTGSGMVLMR